MSTIQRHVEAGRLRLEFPPLLELMDQVAQEVRNFLEEHGLAADAFPLELISREAVCNAVIHGSGLSPSRPVIYELELGDGCARITVEDGGDGWDWKSQCCTLPSENEEAGRGLFIIRSYSDNVEFNDKGNRICIRKVLTGREENT